MSGRVTEGHRTRECGIHRLKKIHYLEQQGFGGRASRELYPIYFSSLVAVNLGSLVISSLVSSSLSAQKSRVHLASLLQV